MTDDKHEKRVSSGFKGLDDVLSGLRVGDNVVLQISRIDEYKPFVAPFAQSCIERKVPLVYFRFARHHPLVTAQDGIDIHQLNPDVGFERFVSTILDIADTKGPGACYIFDCLSDLAVDWYSDQMLSNFFMITCPYLYKLDTIAYFAVDYSYHSKRAIDAITDTAQVIIRVYENNKRLYIQPLKATGRYSPTMFMLHEKRTDRFQPATCSAILSEILSSLPKPNLDFRVRQAGVWTRTFTHASETLAAVNSGKLTYWEARDSFSRLLRMIATRDERVIRLAEQYLDLSDLVDIMHRMIGTGLIGGKALGMLLARAILRKDNPKWAACMETHDSFFVGSDVFYTYLVQNDCWWLRRDVKKSESTRIDLARKTAERIQNGVFPRYIRKQFMEMLDYFGQSPIIVRSSSLLEDNYGNAFSGKYESVFCPSQLAPEQRLNAFENAVRKVYASALDTDALEYRAQRGLLEQDEQMALLVQRVSGDLCGDTFFPQLAGVGFSFNPYVWDKAIDPHSGFLRLVMGLGTRAVDRLEDDYTRLVALNAPDRRTENSMDDIRRYSQHHVDVLDLPSNSHKAVALRDIAATIDSYALNMCTIEDTETAERARQRGVKCPFNRIVTFDNLLNETSFAADLREMLAVLHAAYEYPVDVEFTANFDDEHKYRINLLQCRPFQANIDIETKSIERPGYVADNDRLFTSAGPIIGPSSVLAVERLVFIDPEAYSSLAEQKKHQLASVIGALNKLHRREQMDVMLIGPGRWGTSSPSLGIPVRFGDISNTAVICELGIMHQGLIPDVSLGSHFFNDLVELGMLYVAVTPKVQGHSLNYERIRSLPNSLLTLLPDAGEWRDVIRVHDAKASQCPIQLNADSMRQEAILYVTN